MTTDSAGIVWAGHLRTVRESTLAQMADGSADLAGVLSMRNDPALGAIHLLSVLEAVPGALKVLTRRRLAELGWDENLPIAALTDEEVADAVREFATPVARPVEA